jgi:dephospho-CoA kinase
MSMRKRVVGLLGGIGSGKSAAAAAFARRGARVIVADTLGHEALRQPAIRQQLVDRWGPELLDESGEIVRRRLGKIVFANDADRKFLEGLSHPWIEGRIREEIELAQADPGVRVIVLDAAIMLETGWNRVCDVLVFVDTPTEVRWQRLAQSRGWTAQEVETRERSQLPLTEKARRADHVLDNSTSQERLQEQVDALLQLWGLAPEPPPGILRPQGPTIRPT